MSLPISSTHVLKHLQIPKLFLLDNLKYAKNSFRTHIHKPYKEINLSCSERILFWLSDEKIRYFSKKITDTQFNSFSIKHMLNVN